MHGPGAEFSTSVENYVEKRALGGRHSSGKAEIARSPSGESARVLWLSRFPSGGYPENRPV
jgi:hypothetical protein